MFAAPNLCQSKKKFHNRWLWWLRNLECLVTSKSHKLPWNTFVALSDPWSMKFSHILDQSPHNRETTMRQNINLTMFHTQNISPCVENCQNYIEMHCWYQIAGIRSWNGEKLWDKSVPYLFLLFKLYLWDWRTIKHKSVFLRVFHAWWRIFCVWKTVRTTFWHKVIHQLRGDCSILW